MVKGLFILLLFQWLGEMLVSYSQAPVPGAVIGMLLLLLALLVRQQVSTGLQQASHSLIQYLSLLFLPAGVGLFFLDQSLQQQWPAIAGAMVLGTLISMLVSTFVVKWLLPSASKAGPNG